MWIGICFDEETGGTECSRDCPKISAKGMTNTPPRKKPRTATPRPQTITNLNAEARRINALIKKEANAEKIRQAKRVATLAKRKAAIQGHKEKIGGIVRRTYLQNHNIAMLVSQHMTPRNAARVAIAVGGSAAFTAAAHQRAANYSAKLARYRNLWGAWYRGLTPNQRRAMTQNITRELYHNPSMYTLAETRNPLLLVKRGLTNRPTIGGTRAALQNLTDVNEILRTYGLPFSMKQAFNNLAALKPMSNRRIRYNVPTGKPNFMASLAAAYFPRPPKGLKGRAGTRARRLWRGRVAYLKGPGAN